MPGPLSGIAGNFTFGGGKSDGFNGTELGRLSGTDSAPLAVLMTHTPSTMIASILLIGLPISPYRRVGKQLKTSWSICQYGMKIALL
jgi:hypothetical protein